MASCLSEASCLSPSMGATPAAYAAALQYFAAAQCILNHKVLPEATVKSHDSFDFIVVGSGSAGSVVASRLSEDPKYKVLVIEAGGDPPIESDIPGFEVSLFDSEYDWSYCTVNDGKTSQALINGTVGWNKGKMFGGSSSINAMYYVRGNDEDYQDWFDQGNKEWSVADVKRCFRQVEHLADGDRLRDAKISEFYGHDGPLHVNKFNSTFGELKKLMGAWQEMGFRNVPDLNMEDVNTSGWLLATASGGVRQSTDRAFLSPVAEQRENLYILKRALVTKVLINEETKTAEGVEVEKDGQKYTIYAKREVILSAGSIESPHLLMLSGVGPAKQLTEKGITPIVDSPNVGQNLRDHSVVPIFIYADEPNESAQPNTYLSFLNYLVARDGPLAHSNIGTDASAFYTTVQGAKRPDSQVIVVMYYPNTPNLKEGFSHTFRYNDTVMDSIVEINKKHGLFLMVFNHLHPLSTGHLALQSNDPKVPLLIYSNYYGNVKDLDTTVDALMIASKVVKTEYFKSINAGLARMDIPECNELELGDKEYWRCVAKNMVSTLWHPVSTCQMGTDISISVVDSRLRVHGVKNLRVIDASVMPGTISGNTNAPTIMIGERGSELVKEDHKE